MIDAPGRYDMPHEDYNADPVVVPSLNFGTAKTILQQSPAHARLQHPRLNPEWAPDEKDGLDFGAATHALLFDEHHRVAVIDAANWRGKEARDQRDQARAQKRIPILKPNFDEACRMIEAARKQIEASDDLKGILGNGTAEQTLVWHEDETWCRCRLDWLPHQGNVFFDYKTTVASANPEEWARKTLYQQMNDLQAVHYRRGIRAVLDRDAHFVFAVQERYPPYSMSIVGLSPGALELGEVKWQEAIGWWRWCMEHGWWPAYPKMTVYAHPPPWDEARWSDRVQQKEFAKEAGWTTEQIYAPMEIAE